jgi:peptide/nickel transport system substrate-binding protein
MSNRLSKSVGHIVVPATITMTALMTMAVAQSQPAPVRGGNLVVAMNVDPPSLDTSQTPSAETARMVFQNVLEGLLGFDADGKIVPRLATSLPTISKDGLNYTFKLRRGVKFHDGSAFDAVDVKAKFERARDPKSGHTSPPYYADITAINTPDPFTVVFQLAKANSNFLYNMARSDSIITPSELVATKAGLESLANKPVGTGPFMVEQWSRGDSLRLARNPNYHVAGLPYLDAVTFRFMGEDQNGKVAALRAGDIDVIGYNVAVELAIGLQKDKNFKVFTGPSSGENTISLNNATKPFNDVRVRRAFTLAMNKKEIVDGAFFGFGTVIGSFNSPGQPYYLDLSKENSYNPERAKQLLREAGYPNGLTVKFTVTNEYPTERKTAEVYAAQLAQIGVNAQIELIPFNTWLTKVFTNKDYEMTIIGHAESFDIDRYARDGYYFNYTSKEFRDLHNKALLATSQAERTTLYYRMQRLLAKDVPGIWAFSIPYVAAARANVFGWPEKGPLPSLPVAKVFKTK